MSDDQHYYIAGYSVEDDPYCQPNGVLTNILGIENTQDLNEFESEMAAIAIKNLLELSPPEEFTVSGLQDIHREIFADVYPWAGKFRVVDIAKGDTVFEPQQTIGEKLEILFDQGKSKNWFAGSSASEFAQLAGDFLIELNRIHPFREGNGRTQRLLLSQMALKVGHRIEWAGISESAMKHACIDGLKGDSGTMKKLLGLYLSPSS